MLVFFNTNNGVELTRNQNRASVRVIVASVLILFSSWYPLLLSMEIWFSLCLHWSSYWLNTQPQQQENQALHIYSLPLNTSRIPFGLSSAVSQGALNANGITVIMWLMNTFVYVCKHFPTPHQHQEQGISTFPTHTRAGKVWEGMGMGGISIAGARLQFLGRNELKSFQDEGCKLRTSRRPFGSFPPKL